MGRSYTPKYRVNIDGRSMLWSRDCKPTNDGLEKWVMTYAKSLHLGGVNGHVSKALGYIPYPHKVELINQWTNKVVATWEAAMFQCFT